MAAKYLKHFPAPLLDDLVNNRWLPFVGAGLSRNAALDAPKKMPLWDQLGKELHKELNDFEYTNALDVISAYSHEYSRAKLIERLYAILFIDEARPGQTHKAFCSLPFDIVCTTNFDFLLESQYVAQRRPCTPILGESQLAINVGAGAERNPSRTTLLKLHGDLNHPDELVVTEDDYDVFIERRPLLSTYTASLLVARTAVLIGYSLDDSDLRQIWRIISTRLGRLRRPAYALTVSAEQAMVARYARRGITVINLPGSKAAYGRILGEAFLELAEYWEANTLRNSTVLREEPMQELSLPADSSSRICFLGAPRHLLAYLQRVLEPIVSKAGFVLVLAQDVVSPGENWLAKIEAILSRSAVAIIARGSDATEYEVKFAMAKLGADRVLMLQNNADAVAAIDIAGNRTVMFGDEIYDDPENFVGAINNWLLARAEHTRVVTENEPRRLLNQNEFRAALVLAIAGIESELRSKAEMGDKKEMSRPLRWFFDYALERGFINQADYRAFINLIKIRNQAIHKNGQVTRSDANQAVRLYEGLLNSIRGQ